MQYAICNLQFHMREWSQKVSANVIHYTCMHCGNITNLPDDKRETIFTCPACKFSNWVSGLAIAEPEPPPPTHAPVGPAHAPHPALAHLVPNRPAGGAGHPRMSQPHSAPKSPPPPPLPPRGQGSPQAPPPGAAPPKPLSALERNLEMLQRDSAGATRPPQYHPRPVHSQHQRTEVCAEAIAATLLGLFNLVTAFIAGPLGFILGVVTLGLAVKAKAKIAAEPARYSGAGLASLAVFLAVLGMVFALVKSCGR